MPWAQWVRPLVTWGIYVWLFYLATLFLTGMLRKQWVEAERLLTASHEEVQGLQKRVDLLEASELARRVQVVCSTSGCLSLPRPF